MPPVRWTFTDPITDVVYTFEANPESGGSPQYRKTIESQRPTAPGAPPIYYEGNGEAMTGSFRGTILSLAHYQAMVTWWNKRYPVVLEDDFGREQTIYIVDFLPERQRSQNIPYRHDFTVNYIVLSLTDL